MWLECFDWKLMIGWTLRSIFSLLGLVDLGLSSFWGRLGEDTWGALFPADYPPTHSHKRRGRELKIHLIKSSYLIGSWIRHEGIQPFLLHSPVVSERIGAVCKALRTLWTLGKGHVTCCQAPTSVTCLASCQNFSKFMWPFESLQREEDRRIKIKINWADFEVKMFETHLEAHPSLRKYKSLTKREKNGITIRSRSSVAPTALHTAA